MGIRLRKVARHAWLTALSILAALVVTIALSLAYLIGTESGRLTLLAQAERWLPVLTGQSLSIDNPSWSTLDQLSFEQLTYQAGTDALTVKVTAGSLQWQPRFAWQRRLWIDALTAEQVLVSVPEATDTGAPPDTGPTPDPVGQLQALWGRIPPIQLAKLTIDEFALNLPGRPVLRTRIDADADINWGVWPARLSLALTGGDTQTVNLSVAVDAVDSLSIRGDVTAPAAASWAEWIDWPLDEPLQGEWDLRLSQTETQWRADIEQIALPWRSHRLQMSGQVSYSPGDTQIYLTPLQARIDDQPLRLSGFIAPRRADLSVQAEALPLALLNDLIPVSDLTGVVSVDGQLTGGWQQPQFAGMATLEGALLGDSLNISTRSTATASGVKLDTGQVRWGEADIDVSGNVQWDTQLLNLTLAWQDLDQSRWKPWVAAWPDDLALTTQGRGSLTGSFTEPQFSGRIETGGQYQQSKFQLATDLSANREQLTMSALALTTDAGSINAEALLQLDGLQLTATTELVDVRSSWLAVAGVELPIEQDWGLDGELEWRGTVTDPVAAGYLTISGQWQAQRLNAALQIDRFDLTRLQLGQSQLQLADTDTELSGTINWQQQSLDLNASLRALRLATVRPFLPALPAQLDDLTGNTTGDVRVDGPWLEPSLDADLRFEGRWLDQPLTLAAQISAENREQWNIGLARLDWAELGVNFTGQVQPFAGQLSGDYQISNLTFTDVRRLPFELPATLDALTGSARASGRIEGAISAMQLTAELGFDGMFEDTPLALKVSVPELTLQQLTLSSLILESGDSQLNASGIVGLQPLRFDLDTELSNLDWQQVTPWIPATVDLPVETLTGQSSASLAISGAWPNLSINGELRSSGEYLNDPYDLKWQGNGTLGDRLMHEARLSWGPSLLQVNLENQGEQVSGSVGLSQVTLDRIRALGVAINEDVSGEISAQASIEGNITDPQVAVEINARGEWSQFVVNSDTNDSWDIRVLAQGQLDDWHITEATANLGPAGNLSLSGSGTRNSVDLQADLDIPQTRLWLGNDSRWEGALQGRLEVSGTPDEPAVAANLDWTSGQWPMQLLLDISTAPGRHRLTAALQENDRQRVLLDISTDQTPLADWAQPLEQRPFTADVELAIDSAVLEPLLRNRPDQDFTGTIDGRLSVLGTLERPEWEGRIRLADGRYENATTGAVLTDMTAQLTANNRTLQFNLDAGDNNGGNLALGGDVVWPQDRELWWMPELDLELEARNARLVRRADIDATIDGSVTVTGPWRDLLVAGLLDVSPLIIQLDSLLQSGAPTLNVVREPTDDNVEPEVREASLYAPAGRWQVRLRAERRAQIYGQGLAAELSGEVDINGELASPNVGGRFQVIRGNYQAFGKNFDIQRGNIQLQGSQILLDIEAVYEGPDITVNLNIQGSQDQLSLSLTSNPALANDELLARLLFGRSIAEMSALQAVQLAAALNSLRNPGGGIDVFGTTRDLLGLDALTLDSGTNEQGESGVNVSAGKYLSDRIYLEVESGVGAERGLEGSLQFQLTPRINAELYSRGQFGAGGVELNWKNDY